MVYFSRAKVKRPSYDPLRMRTSRPSSPPKKTLRERDTAKANSAPTVRIIRRRVRARVNHMTVLAASCRNQVHSIADFQRGDATGRFR